MEPEEFGPKDGYYLKLLVAVILSVYTAVQLALISVESPRKSLASKCSPKAMGPTPAGVPVIMMSKSSRVRKVFS